MAFSVGQLLFGVGADVGDLDKKIKGAFRGVLKEAAALTVGFLTVKKALDVVGGTISEAVRAASDADKGFVELSSALARAGEKDAVTAAQAFADFAGELQSVTGLSDDAIQAAGKVGASFGITGERLQATATAAADMASVLGLDLNSAMLQIAKSAGSSTNSLARYGVEIDNNLRGQQRLDAILTALSAKFEGAAAAAAQTYAGRVKILTENWGDAHEELGRAITQNETVNAVLVVAAQQVQQLGAWIKNNRATMSEWVSSGWGAIVTAAGIFVSSMEFAGKAMAAFKIVGNLAIAGVVELFDLLLSGVQATMRGLGALASVAGLSDLHNAIADAHNAIGGFRRGVQDTRDTFLATANDGVDMWRSVGAGADAARAKIAGIDTQVRETAATMSTELPRAATVAAAGVSAAMQTVFDFGGEITAEFAAVGQTMTDELANSQKQIQADALQAFRDQAAIATTAIGGISGAVNDLFEAWAAGTATATENLAAFLGAVLATAERVIQTYAAQAAAAAASWAGILGPIGMAVAASAAFALVRGFLTKLPKAAEGGIVTGGISGRDSVPILAMPGEMILPVDTTRALLAASRRGAGRRAAAGGVVGADRGAGGQQITFQVQLLEEASEEQVDRLLIKLGRRVGALQRRGLYPA